MLIFNFGEWAFWELYDPNDIFGNQKVTFDGPNKLILINYGETDISVQEDIYSNWKEWMMHRDNSKFEQALTAVGGDPLPGSRFLGITYFLENDWKIQPFGGAEHRLTVTGNLYSRDGTDPFVDSEGDYKVTIETTVSNLVDLVASPLSDTESAQLTSIWQLHGLDSSNPLTVETGRRYVGNTDTPEIDQTIVGDDPVTVTRTV